ncbi:RraA family protein [Oscillospiraceae bacterium LTW-04]|nr:RraA family protein [Oscillospiraceae bacterium MB24-C1]
MSNYKPLPELIDNELVARAAAFGTAQLCDGMKSLGIERDGCMDYNIMPITPGVKMAGTACTVETQDGDNFPIHVAIYQGKPGYVMVIDGKSYYDRAYMGDLMGGAAKAIGLEGIVVDGCIRDRIGLTEMGLNIFSRGYMQRGPSKKGPGKINEPVCCGGVTVNPGDLVVGDCDGVTVVPRDRIEEVLALAAKKDDYEQKRREAISEYTRCREAGFPLPDLTPDWVKAML